MRVFNRIFKGRRPSQERPLAAIIAGLWRNGEQGLWYDASDLSTMFQDAAGTLPVYAPGGGQVDPPVGLWLDKRLRLTMGAPLTVPDFTPGAGWTRSAAVASSSGLSFTTTGTGGMYKTVNNYFTVGRLYDISVEYTKSDAVAAFSLVNTDNGLAPSPVVATGSAASGILTARWFSSASGGMYFRLSAAGTVTITSIVVREITGNHAYQTTTTSRPTLSARYNGFLASEKFDDPYWAATQNFDVAKTAETADPDGGGSAWKITSTTGTASLSKVIGAGYRNPVLTIWVKSGTHTPGFLVRNTTTATNLVSRTAAQTSDFSNTYGICTNSNIGNGWRRIRIEITSGVATSDQVAIYFGATGAVPVGQYFYLYRIDVREANDGVGLPEYQRVVDANTYDTIGFPLYLRFDGVDDFLQTTSIDFSAFDKIFATAAMKKASDATAAVVFELSPAKNSNTGVFAILAPGTSTIPDITWASKGTVEALAVAQSLPAPVSCVVTGIGDISGARSQLRINGAAIAANTASQGSGGLGNYVLYIGRRGGTSLPFNGRLYALLIRSGATPDTTIAKVERYLNQKAKVF